MLGKMEMQPVYKNFVPDEYFNKISNSIIEGFCRGKDNVYSTKFLKDMKSELLRIAKGGDGKLFQNENLVVPQDACLELRQQYLNICVICKNAEKILENQTNEKVAEYLKKSHKEKTKNL